MNGVIYVATGHDYVEEATISAKSLRQQSVNIDITLFTDLEKRSSFIRDKREVFDEIKMAQLKEHPRLTRIDCLERTPYERTLYLDSDTYIIGDINPLFKLLNRFDFAASHAPIRSTKKIDSVNAGYPMEDIPSAFPEVNGGVLLFRKNSKVGKMFSLWKNHFTDLLKKGGDNLRDQGTLRRAIFESNIRLSILPPEYNLRYRYLNYVESEVVILHSRSPRPKRVANIINKKRGPRIYIPSLGVLKQRNVLLKVVQKIKQLIGRWY